MKQTRLPTVGLLFEKDGANYTKGALLYQDILLYSLTLDKDELGDSKPFRHWDLAQWLMNNNLEFVNRYKQSSNGHTNISNRIENTQNRTKGALSDLIDLRLIQFAGTVPQHRGTGVVHIYKFPWIGFLFGWLIEGIKHDKQEHANEEIFKLFDSYFKRPNHPSSNIYTLHLYNKFKDKGVFGEFIVDNIREISTSSNARNVHELLEKNFDIMKVKDYRMQQIFIESLKQTMEEVDSRIKMLAMHSLKLEIESKMREQALDLKTFENMQFDIRNDYGQVVIVGNCKNCNAPFSALSELLQFIAFNSCNRTIRTQCTRCQTGEVIFEKF